MDTTADPGPAGTRRELLALGLASLVLLVAALSVRPLAQLVIGRVSDDDSFDIPFTGWPVDAVLAGIGMLVVVALVVCALLVRRRWVALRGRTPYRRIPMLLALLPGLGLGLAVVPSAMAAPVGWAAEHTSEARELRAQMEADLAAYQRSPALPTPDARPAAPELGRTLLSVADLGPGWYDGETVNPSAHTRPGGEPAARSILERTHREGAGWAPAAPLLMEHVKHSRSAAAARSEVLEQSDTLTSRRTIRVDGVGVVLGTSRSSSSIAYFAIGEHRFSLFATGPAAQPSFEDLVTRAVRKAQAGLG